MHTQRASDAVDASARNAEGDGQEDQRCYCCGRDRDSGKQGTGNKVAGLAKAWMDLMEFS